MREKLNSAIQLYPITAGALVGIAVAAIALVLVLNEQSNGRKRDKDAEQQRDALRMTDKRLGDAITAIQNSRRESVKIGCKTNQGQNNVLLAIINLSIENAERDGRQIKPEDLVAVRALLRPITPERTKKVCDALLERVDKGPPPPPLPETKEP